MNKILPEDYDNLIRCDSYLRRKALDSGVMDDFLYRLKNEEFSDL